MLLSKHIIILLRWFWYLDYLRCSLKVLFTTVWILAVMWIGEAAVLVVWLYESWRNDPMWGNRFPWWLVWFLSVCDLCVSRCLRSTMSTGNFIQSWSSTRLKPVYDHNPPAPLSSANIHMLHNSPHCVPPVQTTVPTKHKHTLCPSLFFFTPSLFLSLSAHKLLGRLCEQNSLLKDQEAVAHSLRMEKVSTVTIRYIL